MSKSSKLEPSPAKQSLPFILQRPINLENSLSTLFLAALTLVLIVELFLALDWRMVHDTPNLHYVAFLIDRFDYAPYRDIFETNLPGTYLFHLAIGRLFGYGDAAFRWIDLTWLLALLCISWGILQRFGKRVAWAGVVLFGLSYLHQGPDASLQRDFVGMLPVAAALLLTISTWAKNGRNKWLAAVGIGMLFGLAATVKPHLLIGLPLLLSYLVFAGGATPATLRERSGRVAGFALLAVMGIALPVGAALFWVHQQGVWPDFLALFQNYLPLYLQLGKNHTIVTGNERLFYLLDFYINLGGFSAWLITAVLGLYLTLFITRFNSATLHVAWLLGALTLAYSIYPIFSGQFFKYHWLPFLYFVVITSALALVRVPTQSTSRTQRLFPLAIMALTLIFVMPIPYDILSQVRGQGVPPPKEGRVDAIAASLYELDVQPGERVQPLDWTGGTIQALLMTESRLATPYLYDYYFYHHPSDPTIQGMRAAFMTELKREPPRMIVENSVKAQVSGPGTTTEFAELRAFIDANYEVAVAKDGYRIYRRVR